MNLSVTDPISKAIETTKRILFQPFLAKKWFMLGFCAWLASMGQGGGCGGQFNWAGRPGGSGSGLSPSSSPGPSITNWIQSNVSWLIPTAIVALIVVAGISALIIWLSCRGKLMLLDGIVRNRGAVREPWARFKNQAYSLFGFSFMLSLMGMVATLVLMVVAAVIAWPDIESSQFGSSAVMAMIVSGVPLLVIGIAFTIIKMLLEEFVVPAMYLTGQNVMPAWTTARQQLFNGRAGNITVFFLMRFVLALGIAVIAGLVVCFTCLLAAIPYLGTVILLPLIVFDRCYTLHFIEQYGPGWQFFQMDPNKPICTQCGYNLSFNVSGVCPECGTPTGIIPPATPP